MNFRVREFNLDFEMENCRVATFSFYILKFELKYLNRSKKIAAAKALGAVGDERAIEPLVAALEDEDCGVRSVVVDALGNFADNRVVYSLITALKDEDESVCKAAAEALVVIGRPSVGQLIVALRDKDVRRIAGDTLVAIGQPSVELLIGELRNRSRDTDTQAVANVLIAIGQPSVEPLVAVLPDYRRRKTMLDVLVKIGQPSAEPLIESLSRWDKDVQEAAVEALVSIGQPSVEPLIAYLENYKRSLSSRIVAKTLGRIADERAIRSLVEVLGYRGFDNYKYASEALVTIGQPSVEPLIEALKDENLNLLKHAIEVLGKIGDERAVEPLVVALNHEDRYIRREAADALGKIGNERAIEALLEALKDEDWNEILYVETQFGGVREAAANALVAIGQPSIEPLVEILQEDDWNVCEIATMLLGKIGGDRAIEALILALKNDNLNLRKIAAEALVEIGEPSVELLVAALKNTDQNVQKLAAKALGEIGDERAIKPLVKALENSSKIDKEIAISLVKLGWKE